MEKFKKGEIAILVYSADGGGIGTECEIISDRLKDYEYYYLVLLDNGNETQWSEKNLRKKKPPKEEINWEKVHEIIGWKPEEVTV